MNQTRATPWFYENHGYYGACWLSRSLAVEVAMRLSKVDSRKRWRKLRDSVNDWDPVGLMALGAPEDEYECLVGPLMRMLEKGLPSDEIASYLGQHIPDHFGVSTPEAAQAFANKIVNWFSLHWKDTSV